MQNIFVKTKYSILIILFFLPVSIAFADYMLPYPSYMPGNKLYTLSRFFDEVGRIWNFGMIAGTKYALHLSDKYLVEAKTLFEYQQYLLGLDALQRSDEELKALGLRNTEQLEHMFREAMVVHISLLSKLRENLPEQFEWRPEKEGAQVLKIYDELSRSIDVRKKTIPQKP